MAKILLVDDNVELLQVQGEFLRLAGYDVTAATDGQMAINFAESEAFDLIITDLIMPEKEGLEMILELRHKIPSLKIIAMSGGGRVNAADYLSIARQLGVSQTLAKPFTGEELLDAVSRVLLPRQ